MKENSPSSYKRISNLPKSDPFSKALSQFEFFQRKQKAIISSERITPHVKFTEKDPRKPKPFSLKQTPKK
jgi:hypothetical protein